MSGREYLGILRGKHLRVLPGDTWRHTGGSALTWWGTLDCAVLQAGWGGWQVPVFSAVS